MNLLAVVQAVAEQDSTRRRSGNPRGASLRAHLRAGRQSGSAGPEPVACVEVSGLVEAQLAHFKDLFAHACCSTVRTQT